MDKITFGKQGELAAKEFLLRKGYTFVAENYRNKAGEIDLIFIDGDFIVFVEVKTRTKDTFGTPEDAVNHFKQRKIIGTAKLFMLNRRYQAYQPRFDVVGVLDGKITHSIDAFWC